MDKQELKKLPVAEASCADAALAKRMPCLEWLMKARRVSAGGRHYLEIIFFRREELQSGELQPAVCTFFDRMDYISRYRSGGEWQWRTGARRKLVYTRKMGTCVSASAMDERRILSWFGAKDGCVTDAIDAFQGQVMEKRLAIRHRKEKEKMEAIMAAVPEMPAGFMEWIRQTFMEESRYFMYRYSGRKKQAGTCTHCGKDGCIDSRMVRHRGKAVCPECGKTVTTLAVGKMRRLICDNSTTLLFQKAGEKPLLRFFSIEKRYRKCSPGVCEILSKEYLRMFYEDGKWRRYEYCAVSY